MPFCFVLFSQRDDMQWQSRTRGRCDTTSKENNLTFSGPLLISPIHSTHYIGLFERNRPTHSNILNWTFYFENNNNKLSNRKWEKVGHLYLKKFKHQQCGMILQPIRKYMILHQTPLCYFWDVTAESKMMKNWEEKALILTVNLMSLQ